MSDGATHSFRHGGRSFPFPKRAYQHCWQQHKIPEDRRAHHRNHQHCELTRWIECSEYERQHERQLISIVWIIARAQLEKVRATACSRVSPANNRHEYELTKCMVSLTAPPRPAKPIGQPEENEDHTGSRQAPISKAQPDKASSLRSNCGEVFKRLGSNSLGDLDRSNVSRGLYHDAGNESLSLKVLIRVGAVKNGLSDEKDPNEGGSRIGKVRRCDLSLRGSERILKVVKNDQRSLCQRIFRRSI